jgi:hypothetical protein
VITLWRRNDIQSVNSDIQPHNVDHPQHNQPSTEISDITSDLDPFPTSNVDPLSLDDDNDIFVTPPEKTSSGNVESSKPKVAPPVNDDDIFGSSSLKSSSKAANKKPAASPLDNDDDIFSTPPQKAKSDAASFLDNSF